MLGISAIFLVCCAAFCTLIEQLFWEDRVEYVGYFRHTSRLLCSILYTTETWFGEDRMDYVDYFRHTYSLRRCVPYYDRQSLCFGKIV